MAQKRRGLGRGLESLLANDRAETLPSETLTEIALDSLEPGQYQPRQAMDPEALAALAQSIGTQGVVQPLVVRQRSDGRGYEIIAGERRWRAARKAGLKTVPAVVRALSEEAAMAIALIENIQREDLNPLEVSTALQRLIDEFGMTHAQCAQAVGRSRTTVSNLLRLADLNDDVADQLRRGELEMGHARCLLSLSGQPQSDAAARIIQQGLTVRQSELMVREMMTGPAPEKTRPQRSPRLQALEDSLARQLATGVRIEPNKRGGGKVVINYRSPDDLDALMGHFESEN